jgi:hypothetical protein
MMIHFPGSRTDCDTGIINTEDMDDCEMMSLGHQGGDDDAAHPQVEDPPGPLNNQLLDIHASNIGSARPDDLPESSDGGASEKTYAYTMTLERQVEQLGGIVVILRRQQRTSSNATDLSHALKQENARLAAESRRLVALVREMSSLRERNEALQRLVEELSKPNF